MKSAFDPENFNMTIATIVLINNRSSSIPELYINQCNSLFSKLTGILPDNKKDVAETAFGKKKEKYLKALLNIQKIGKAGELVLRFKSTRKWLYTRICPGEASSLQMIGFDYTFTQRQLNAFKLRETGYKNYIENFHGLAYQRLLKPEVKSVFTAGAYRQITGYSSEQGKDLKTWLEIVHPEDQGRIREAASELYDDKEIKSETDYRIIRKDGEIRWMHSYDCNIKSEDGNMQMVQGLIVDVTNRKEQELKLQEANKKIIEQNAELEELSLTDHLTGLSNRRSIQQVLKYLIEDYKRTEESFSILMLDIDYFKQVNDRYGHDGGDTVLCGISRIFNESLRQIDVKARWGGEEFLILLPHTNKTEAKKIAENLLSLVRKTIFEHNNINIQITFSGGVKTYHRSMSLQILLHDADRALYEAKKNGRNRIVAY